MSNSTTTASPVEYLVDPVSLVITYLRKDDDVIDEDVVLAEEPVPQEVDVFSLMKILAPENVSRFDQWTIRVKENSTEHREIQQKFKEIEELLWHLETPPHLRVLLLGLYLPIATLGASLNAVILAIMLSSKIIRSDPRHVFIVTLAISDFFLCTFTAPLTLWNILEGHWPLEGAGTELLCKILKAAQDFPVFMSSFCIGAIACDRFRFIVQPHKKQLTTCQALFVSVALAIVSSAYVSPIFVAAGLMQFPRFFGEKYFCELESIASTQYTMITNASHYLLTLAMVCILYAAIYWKLRSRPPSQHASQNRRRRRTNIYLASITSLFFLSWFPLVIYSTIFELDRSLLPTRHSVAAIGYALTLLCGFATAIANPILYAYHNENTRKAFRESRIGRLARFVFPGNNNNNSDGSVGGNGVNLGDNCTTAAIGGVPSQIVTANNKDSSPAASPKEDSIHRPMTATSTKATGTTFEAGAAGSTRSTSPDEDGICCCCRDDESLFCGEDDQDEEEKERILETEL